jgi:glycosyltransferase involved in cell wall biosynthesis
MADTIIINGRFLSQPVTGVQRYALEVIQEMDVILKEDIFRRIKVVCLVPPEKHIFPGWNNIEIQTTGFNKGNLWEQIDLSIAAKGRLIFSPANTGPFYYSNQVITFHDASVFAVPDAYSFAFRAKYSFIFRSLARISRRILTDSFFSQRELSYYLGVPANRFSVIPLGGDHLASIQPNITILQRHGLTKDSYLLSVASQSPHKNFGRILEAAALVTFDMTFAAAGGSFKRVFQKTKQQFIPPSVHLLGYVSDSELKALYENAFGFIFPSIYEGFGLPILEAMNCDCPVLCSSAASLPETGGEAVLYFNPSDTDSLVAVIHRFLNDPALKASLQKRGRENAKRFSWEKTARETLKALVSCL